MFDASVGIRRESCYSRCDPCHCDGSAFARMGADRLTPEQYLKRQLVFRFQPRKYSYFPKEKVPARVVGGRISRQTAVRLLFRVLFSLDFTEKGLYWLMTVWLIVSFRISCIGHSFWVGWIKLLFGSSTASNLGDVHCRLKPTASQTTHGAIAHVTALTTHPSSYSAEQ